MATSRTSEPACRPSATGSARAWKRPAWKSCAPRALGERDGRTFCLALPERAGVVAVPTVVFYDDKEAGRSLVRFAFCKRDEVIDEAVARLSRLQG
jgi:aspartate/methionine/tyrosine aminotransferase